MDAHRYYENPGPQDWHIDTSGIMIDVNSFTDEEANKLIGEQQSESRANRNWERSDQLFTSGAINGRGISLDATERARSAWEAFNAKGTCSTKFSQQEADVGATLMAHRENS